VSMLTPRAVAAAPIRIDSSMVIPGRRQPYPHARGARAKNWARAALLRDRRTPRSRGPQCTGVKRIA
jgi:hypothetical protein